MHLNRATDIGLRIVLYTAELDALTKIDELAEALAVPRHHLAKIVHRLQRLGVLETTRGRGGGVRLAENAGDWQVGHLVRALEGDTDPVNCADPVPCPLVSTCQLRGALKQAQEAFYASLDDLRVRDLSQWTPAPVTVPVPLGMPTRPAEHDEHDEHDEPFPALQDPPPELRKRAAAPCPIRA